MHPVTLTFIIAGLLTFIIAGLLLETYILFALTHAGLQRHDSRVYRSRVGDALRLEGR
ncbi:predicted protein [Plenodomus lingam JN3]|uniref:Predicted protein n=1 Tax=Leptosphaeria maculans (strain JN3 / isolate v23.1.3 / race Av1-4-5-6-7-8) TaxID=985895 RepID=E4ZQW9_LEPMJ|nr:predicted protein [Plenodomus lingam JN3]CBX94124.1 predicted protein [Plenodomus lingam JN3]